MKTRYTTLPAQEVRRPALRVRLSRGELLVLQRAERCPLSGKGEGRRALSASAHYLVQAISPGLAAVVGAVGVDAVP